MNPTSFAEAKRIYNGTRNAAKLVKNTDCIICPPFPYIGLLSKLDKPKNLIIGAQNIFNQEKGAFTGEVGAPVVADLGAKYVIIGHSERRAAGEDNETIRKKTEIALNNNLVPILCIGERERDRDGKYFSFIKGQIKDGLSGLQKKDLVGFILAYEPVWAIGRSYREAMNSTDVHEITLVIKKIIGEFFGKDISATVKILYGGSVEAENATDIIEKGNVDGFLVGHASLVPERFGQILKAADLKK